MKDVQRATEPFFTTKGIGKGSGLGLSMVQGVAEQSGGWFNLRSRKGEGTTAELWLPAAEGQAKTIDRSEPVSDSARHQSPLVVLAVDDDGLVLTNTLAMLDDSGHTEIAASSGDQALDMLRKHHSIDLVITDYAMPKMTGLQLADAIKKSGLNFPSLSRQASRRWSRLASHPPKLAKPFTEAQLAIVLANIASKKPKSGRVLKFPAGSTPAI